jgi:PRTRC genetic system protein E
LEKNMFASIEKLVQSTGKLAITVFPGKDGLLKVCVVPLADSSKEAALAQPLILTGSAADLDAGFADAVSTYEASRNTLVAQVEATTAILEAAKKAQSNTAVNSLKGKTTKRVGPVSTSGVEEELEIGTSTSVQSHPAPAEAGTDLLSLI